jgi:hypothetical protein
VNEVFETVDWLGCDLMLLRRSAFCPCYNIVGGTEAVVKIVPLLVESARRVV